MHPGLYRSAYAFAVVLFAPPANADGAAPLETKIDVKMSCERAAEPGEWAVSGAFLFAGCDPEMMATKERHVGFAAVAAPTANGDGNGHE